MNTVPSEKIYDQLSAITDRQDTGGVKNLVSVMTIIGTTEYEGF